MKAATLGLVFGALSVAQAQFLEDEDSLLQEEWEDFDDRELQDIDSLLEEAEEGDSTAAVYEDPDIGALEEGGEDEGEGEDKKDRRRKKRRSNRRRDRRRNNRKNRRGKKGRKGRKGKGKKDKKKKKGPFNVEDFKNKLAKRADKTKQKLEKKCNRRNEYTQAFCE